jgi:DNA-binding transcriptional LysR family regulator
MHRTTRQLATTDAGDTYYEHSRTILALVEEAHDSVRISRDSTRGRIRVSVSSAFAILHLSPLWFAFQDANPGMALEVSLTDERIDLVREGVDLAIRFGQLSDSSLISRRLGEAKRILVASPDYLQSRGEPHHPRDLVSHNVIRFFGLSDSDRLCFTSAAKTETIDVSGDFQANHAFAIREALLAGRGLGPAHHWLVADLIESGRLRIILPEYRLSPVPLHLLLVPGRNKIARVKLLVDFLAQAVRSVPGIE